MPVTELAILPLTSQADLYSSSFLAKLLQSQKVMANALGTSGRRFTYYQGIEDPRNLYLIGDWESPAEHWEQFIPSAQNQALLELLKDEFDIEGIEMYHVDVACAEVPVGAEVVSIGWHRVRKEDKEGFERVFAECRGWLDGYVSGDEKPAGGWRVEKDPERQDGEEWVLFCGWNSVEEHTRFAQTEAFEKYSRIRDRVQEFQLKHGKRLELS